MKRLAASILFFACAIPSLAQTPSQYALFSATNIADLAGNRLASGTFTATPVLTPGSTSPAQPQLAGGGRGIAAPIVFSVTAGVISATYGAAQLVDVTQANPANFCYATKVHDNNSGNTWNLDSCLQPAYNASWCTVADGQTSCDYDNYVPTGVPGALTSAGPVGMNWRGAWSGSNTYGINDGVYYSGSGSAYISTIAANTNTPPGTGWSLVVQAGAGTIPGLTSDGSNGINVTGAVATSQVNTDLYVTAGSTLQGQITKACGMTPVPRVLVPAGPQTISGPVVTPSGCSVVVIGSGKNLSFIQASSSFSGTCGGVTSMVCTASGASLELKDLSIQGLGHVAVDINVTNPGAVRLTLNHVSVTGYTKSGINIYDLQYLHITGNSYIGNLTQTCTMTCEGVNWFIHAVAPVQVTVDDGSTFDQSAETTYNFYAFGIFGSATAYLPVAHISMSNVNLLCPNIDTAESDCLVAGASTTVEAFATQFLSGNFSDVNITASGGYTSAHTTAGFVIGAQLAGFQNLSWTGGNVINATSGLYVENCPTNPSISITGTTINIANLSGLQYINTGSTGILASVAGANLPVHSNGCQNVNITGNTLVSAGLVGFAMESDGYSSFKATGNTIVNWYHGGLGNGSSTKFSGNDVTYNLGSSAGSSPTMFSNTCTSSICPSTISDLEVSKNTLHGNPYYGIAVTGTVTYTGSKAELNTIPSTVTAPYTLPATGFTTLDTNSPSMLFNNAPLSSPAPVISAIPGDTACALHADPGASPVTPTAGSSTSTTFTFSATNPPFAFYYPGQRIQGQNNTPSGYNGGPFQVVSVSGTNVTVTSTANPGTMTGFGTFSLYCANQVNDAVAATPYTFLNDSPVGANVVGVSQNTWQLRVQGMQGMPSGGTGPLYQLYYNASPLYSSKAAMPLNTANTGGTPFGMGFDISALSTTSLAATGISTPFGNFTNSIPSEFSSGIGIPTNVVTTAPHNFTLTAYFPSTGVASAAYVSGGTFSGTGNCSLGTFNNSSTAAATIAVSSGTPGAITITNPGQGATAAPTSAVLSSGTATCSGSPVISTVPGGSPGNWTTVELLTTRQ